MLRRRGDGGACSNRSPWYPPRRSSAWGTSGSSRRASCPGTTSSCTASIHARLSSSQRGCAARRRRRAGTFTRVPELVLGTAARHARADPHPRPCRGPRAMRRGPSTRPPRTDRAHRLAGQGHGSATSSPRGHSPGRSIASPLRRAPELPGKEPAAIMVSVAADLLRSFATENSTSRHDDLPGPGTGHPRRPVHWRHPVLTATPDCAWSTGITTRGPVRRGLRGIRRRDVVDLPRHPPAGFGGHARPLPAGANDRRTARPCSTGCR